ncbi:WD40 repeat-like protein [Neolentinus lepideus HHB14362 ss-1]|uniref:WD40 repeat-like protein n=1 Tax=Neolentinus lepideus HHB14362 ss-1 TaxID=1314782 RepID=A0A165QDM2_9AGAM|nr:WD40 repeat-like protein [Neolentinus lepideus HHB14362 ss-1]
MAAPDSRRSLSADARDVVLVDGAFSAVPRNLTVTRPSSPVPTMDFSLISRPTSMVQANGDDHQIDYFEYGHDKSCSFFPSPSSRSRFDRISPCRSAKGLLPRLWDALSSPGKKGKAKANYIITTFDYSELPPLDGEEGELIDEACYIDALAVTGIDILSRLPPEIALYLLLFLDLPSILACLSVSKRWRTLAADNGVWKELFYQKAGWQIDLDRAWVRGWDGMRFVSNSTPSIVGGWISRTPSFGGESRFTVESRGRRRVTALLSPQPAISTSASFGSMTLAPGSLAPLSLDWRPLYKARLELEKRWVSGEPRVTRISGHTDSVYCLEFDSSRIITGSRDRSIKVWSLRTGRLLATFRGHAGSVLCLKFDKDWDVRPESEDKDGLRKGFMVSGSSDCSVCVWDLYSSSGGGKRGSIASGLTAGEVRAEVKAVLRGHTGGVLDLRIDGEWIVSCSKDALIRVWNRETLSLHTTFRGHEGPVNAVGLQAGKVVSASGDGKMMLWDILSGERLRTFEGHDRGLACIEFKDDLIVSGSNDCKIKVWSATTGECLRTLVGHDLLVRALSFDPPTGRLVSASYDRTVKVWDLNTGKMIREFRNSHVSHIFDVKFDVSRIVSTSHDQKIVVLDFGQDVDTALFV